jgi:curved DNA-binding protein CbpA
LTRYGRGVQPDPYRVLGIPHGASPAVILDAYRRLSKLHHPDRGGSPERFREIQRAVETLRGRPAPDESLEERLARMEAELGEKGPPKRGEDPAVTRVNDLIDGLDGLSSQLDNL